jgi:N-methylhydantoinase A/oxoprolinase/acetone carboxylase beta subunit
LLHSYANPAHEERLGQLLRAQFPEAYVSLSHEILREFREYERTSTTVLNSYVGPIVSRYLVSLEKRLGDSGFQGTFRVMQSNGGVMSAETAKKMPVTMMESGPVAGVIAAADVGELLGCHHIISFDMGGTTAKASLIKDFHPEVTSSYYVGGYVAGHPMMLPVVDIVEVGNGGGSIAWIDPAGGKDRTAARAAPGPACCGQGVRTDDRRQSHRRTHRSGIISRQRDSLAAREGRRDDHRKDRQAARLVFGGSSVGNSDHCQFQHVPGGACRVGGEGLRPARLCAGASGGGGRSTR